MSEMKFETARTRELKAGGTLGERDSRTVSDIEEFGCSIVMVDGTDRSLNWAYTIGVFDTCGRPELIVAGLQHETAKFLLNDAVDLHRQGVDLSVGRHRDLLGNVEVELLPVDRRWIEHVMGWAVWYNNRIDFPVLQVIYPDLENRFPKDDGFNEHFSQPLLQPGAPMGTLEEDFWAMSDPESSLFNWAFPNPPHSTAYLSKTVSSGEEPVTYVSHDRDDGAWQFLGDSMADGGGPVLVCLHHPIDADPTLTELADLPVGWVAERAAVGEPWVRSEHPPGEDKSATANADSLRD